MRPGAGVTDHFLDRCLLVVRIGDTEHDLDAGFRRVIRDLVEYHLRDIAPGLAAEPIDRVLELVPIVGLFQKDSETHHANDGREPWELWQLEVGFDG